MNCKDIEDEGMNLPGLGLAPGSAPRHSFAVLAQKEELVRPLPELL